MKIYLDLTNLMQQEFISGIQRVVRELTVRLIQQARNLNYEIVLLSYHEASGKYLILDTEKVIDLFQGIPGEKRDCYSQDCLSVFDFEGGSVFFELDAVWMNPVRRSFLYPLLKNHNVRIITFFHDLIPITHPHFFHPIGIINFMNFLEANLRWADTFLVSTSSTAAELQKIQQRLGFERQAISVLPLGFNFHQVKQPVSEISDSVKKIKASGPYILCVGTIEIRKNHQVILDAFDERLHQDGFQLVFAGRNGWMADELMSRIMRHPLRGKGFYFLENLNDASIDALYRNAFLTVSASFVEGFGLPLIESLMRGTPVIASDIPVFREIGGGFCDYFDPLQTNDLIQKIERYLHDPLRYAEKKASLSKFKPVTWDEAADAFSEVLFTEKKTQIFHDSLKQIIIRSERMDLLTETIHYLEHFLPFISEAVIITSSIDPDNFSLHCKTRLKFIWIQFDYTAAQSLVSENPFWWIADDRIDPVFLLSEDNYRPLFPLSEDYYIENGVFKVYFCGDFFALDILSESHFFTSEMRKTTDFLKEHHFPLLNYDSRMPQVISKACFLKMFQEYPETYRGDLDIRSIYINIVVYSNPDMYIPLPYQTLNWEFGPLSGESFVHPQRFQFENYDAVLYEAGQPLFNFSQCWHDGTLLENINKIQHYERGHQQRLSAAIAEKVFSQIYEGQYRELPSFVIECCPNKLSFSIPSHYQFVHGADKQIDVRLVWRKFPKETLKGFSLKWELRSTENDLVFEDHEDVFFGQAVVTLGVNVQAGESELFFTISGNFSKTGKIFSKTIPVQILFL